MKQRKLQPVMLLLTSFEANKPCNCGANKPYSCGANKPYSCGANKPYSCGDSAKLGKGVCSTLLEFSDAIGLQIWFSRVVNKAWGF